jgi:hypothetical protein
MKRISIKIFVAMTLAFLIYHSGQAPSAYSQTGPKTKTAAPRSGQDEPRKGKDEPRKGKALVSKMPADDLGVTLKDGMVKVNPGNKFVKQADGTVTVARIKGGAGIGGKWDCDCSKGGTCDTVTNGTGLSCKGGSCTGTCTLTITTTRFKTGVVMY